MIIDSGLTKGQTLPRDSAMEVVGPQLQSVHANGELAVASCISSEGALRPLWVLQS